MGQRPHRAPLVDGEYAASSAAGDDSLAASVAALGVATDQALDRFLGDLERALQEAAP